ncbi:MAG TPA: hypothetical protein VM513_27685 [Kofleriaceae bacterium]|jgi:hypothetical protein|nr:hypothetical protein [Kofleriaceae bacterium]
MSDAVSTPSAPSGGSAPAASAPSAPQSTPSTTQTAASPAANGPPSTQQPPAGATEAQKAEWRRKVKIDGREVEVGEQDIPAWLREAAGEEEALSTYRIRAASQARMKEAAELRKQSESIMGRLKGDSMVDALLELHGGDAAKVDAAMERYYAQRLRESEMTPQQREHAKLQRELDQMRAEKQRHAEERQQAERARVRDEYAKRWQAEFPEALKAVKLPMNKATVARMVAHAREALAANQPIEPMELARNVAAELREEWGSLHGEMDVDAVLDLIGEERMKAVRARDIERLKASQAPAVAPAPVATPRDASTGRFQSKGSAPPQSMRDFFKKRRDSY